MEYLVTMTTHVPDDVPEAAVRDTRDREAARSRVLAAQGHLLRLWRPPLRPGEWRTLGLFDADNDAELEDVLASMPLRVWRTDQITPLSAHPNDPLGPSPKPGSPALPDGSSEFLTTFRLTVSPGTPSAAVEAATAREAVTARALAHDGHLMRLWRLPADGGALGLWRAHDIVELQKLLASLPLDPWLTEQITPLAPHPSDPALVNS